MDDTTRQQILKIFSKYYSTAPLEILQPERREFGVGIIKKIDHRHLAFPSINELQAYLSNNPPFFVSHSTAYYSFPDATPIEKKEWQAADLVFDLDFHDEKFEVYKKIDRVKQDAIRLMEDFLLCDFGIGKKDLLVAFSGNRGYHIHVRHPDFAMLGSDERKRLVDYVRGLGLDYAGFFSSEEIKKGVIKVSGPTPDEDGYRGKFARAVLACLEKSPASISRIFKKPEASALFAEGITEGNWSKVPMKGDILPKLKFIADALPLQTVDTDAGVTQDVSKLIRVPNSIHGETGLIAKVVAGSLDAFEPLKDALLPMNGTATIRMMEYVPELELAVQTQQALKIGQHLDLNRAYALFLILKGSAELA